MEIEESKASVSTFESKIKDPEEDDPAPSSPKSPVKSPANSTSPTKTCSPGTQSKTNSSQKRRVKETKISN